MYIYIYGIRVDWQIGWFGDAVCLWIGYHPSTRGIVTPTSFSLNQQLTTFSFSFSFSQMYCVYLEWQHGSELVTWGQATIREIRWKDWSLLESVWWQRFEKLFSQFDSLKCQVISTRILLGLLANIYISERLAQHNEESTI